jgi:hypothetical protein
VSHVGEMFREGVICGLIRVQDSGFESSRVFGRAGHAKYMGCRPAAGKKNSLDFMDVTSQFPSVKIALQY